MKKVLLSILTSTIFSFIACNNTEETGGLQFFIQPEWTIVNGIQPGDGEENMKDGWEVKYERFLITVGNISVRQSDTNKSFELPNTYVVDLKNTPQGGVIIGEISGLDAGNWDQVSYGIYPADQSTQKMDNVSQEDFQYMQDNYLAISVRMKLTKQGGQSCNPGGTKDGTDNCVDEDTVILDWDIPLGVLAGGCSPGSGEPGVVVPAGSNAQVKLTIHGDHWFFTAFRHENIERRAQHLVNCDLDHDGTVTIEELQQVPLSSLDPQIYDISTLPYDAQTMLDYVMWAARTLPHFQGDGGCPDRTPIDPPIN